VIETLEEPRRNKILAVATMLAVAVLTLGLLAPLGNRFLPERS
jgi:hypothetical protein